jgi:hypothetical protein
MPCKHAEQPLSRSELEDTGAPAPMEIMMVGPPKDICLLAGSPQSLGIRDGPGAALSRERELEPRGHVVAQSYLEPGAGARAAGTRGGPRAAPIREREPELRRHAAAPELPRAGSGSPSRGDTRRPRSCPELGAGARAMGTRGGSRAALSREAGAIVLI